MLPFITPGHSSALLPRENGNNHNVPVLNPSRPISCPILRFDISAIQRTTFYPIFEFLKPTISYESFTFNSTDIDVLDSKYVSVCCRTFATNETSKRNPASSANRQFEAAKASRGNSTFKCWQIFFPIKRTLVISKFVGVARAPSPEISCFRTTGIFARAPLLGDPSQPLFCTFRIPCELRYSAIGISAFPDRGKLEWFHRKIRATFVSRKSFIPMGFGRI